MRHSDALAGRPGWKLEGTSDMPAEINAKRPSVEARMYKLRDISEGAERLLSLLRFYAASGMLRGNFQAVHQLNSGFREFGFDFFDRSVQVDRAASVADDNGLKTEAPSVDG